MVKLINVDKAGKEKSSTVIKDKVEKEKSLAKLNVEKEKLSIQAKEKST